MEFVLSLLIALLIGGAIAYAVREGRGSGALQPPASPGPARPEPTTDRATLNARLRALGQELDVQMESLVRPLDALELEKFQEGVELLRDPGFSAADLAALVNGVDWTACCLACEALVARDDGVEAVDAVLANLKHLYAWPMVFALRFLDAKYDGPAFAHALCGAQPWWADNPAMTQTLNNAAHAWRERGRTVSFGDRLVEGVYDVEALGHVLARLDRDLFAGMHREFDAWCTARADTGFLRSIGTFLAPHDDEWLPGSERLMGYLDRMRQAQAEGGARSILLVGEPGVGSGALVRHFVRERAAAGWRNLETSAAALIAGKKYLGEIEGQVEKLRASASAAKRVAVYIKQFHQLLGAGIYTGKREGVLELLLPAIEKGEMLIVGCTTPDGCQRMLQQVPRLALTMEIVRLEPAADAETKMLAEEYLVQSGACADTAAAATLAGETLQLARQHLPFSRTPGAVLRLLEMVLLAREDGTEDTPPVTRNDVLASLSRLTGLPRDVLDENQSLSIGALTEAFERKVIGQPEAVQCLVERIAMLKAGLTDSSRPIGVFLFAGPTGTGKTELAKTLAELIFGDEDRMIRLDMSEFQRPDSLEKILGGADARGPDQSLAARIRQQPFAVVLLDEFEKAHSRVWDLFLQVFDDGRLSDATGNTVNFRHTFILLTSNLGSTIREHPGLGFTSRGGGFSPGDVMHAVNRAFRKEFINRLDRVIVFNPLSRAVMRKILTKELRLALERRGFRHREWAVEWEDTAVAFLLDKGFTLDMGARPLRRAIERYFLAPLSMTIVENRFPRGDQFLFVRSDDERLQVSFVDPDADDDVEAPVAAPGHLTLKRIALHPSHSGAERDLLLARSRLLEERLESPEWETQKTRQLARMNEPGFWEDPGRHESLDRVEFLDRIESAGAAVRRLAARLQNSGGSRELNRQVAQKLYLIDVALTDLDEDRPRHALLRLDASSVDGDDVAKTAFDAAKNMYLGWAKQRGMRTRTLRESANGAVAGLTLAVAGFGACSILARERGLHLFEYSGERSGSTRRAHVMVRVAPQPCRPENDRERFAALAETTLAEAPTDESVLVRRYQILSSPLVRDKVGNWRTGRLDLVLQGNFDLIEA